MDGRLIGHIEEKQLSGARNHFYFAWGVHPESGKEYRLEGSIYFDERVQVVYDFYRDPSTGAQHLGI